MLPWRPFPVFNLCFLHISLQPLSGAHTAILLSFSHCNQSTGEIFWCHQPVRGLVCRVICRCDRSPFPSLPPQILDFGLARSTDAEMTGYVVTRWYRAPEVILNWMHYTQTGKTIAAVPLF